MIPEDRLFWRPRDIGDSFAMFSCGEYILRAAATVEQTFGGITTRLWDDPFEWTLPEKLHDAALIQEYMDEVEVTRTKGFSYFTSDDDLLKSIPSPKQLLPIFDLLLSTLTTAYHYQGRAFAVLQTFSGEKLPSLLPKSQRRI
ncbi:MAG: hypothetical protein ACT4O9_09190 [Blastocatellia bacterium]